MFRVDHAPPTVATVRPVQDDDGNTIAVALESIANSLRHGFHSEYGGADLGTHSPSDDEELNVTGGLFAIAHGLNRIADAITQYSADETERRG
jgi:hypothetical protein